MQKFYLSFIIGLCSLSSLSQERYFETEFPEDWLGQYQGIMYIAHHKMGLTDTVQVQFHLNETSDDSLYTYVMIYKSPKFGNIVKDYLLRYNDDKKELILDEKDGILIPEVLIGNTMYSNFEVGNVQISSILRNHLDYLDFELITTEPSYTLDTQSFPDENGETYEVKSTYPKATQFVRFYPIPKEKKWKTL